MKSFCIIIPTMWCSPLINEMLPIYCASKFVSQVIIIDNKPAARPGGLLSHPKLMILPQASNIFVNPAWNLGVSFTDQYPILANDDIQVSGLNLLLEEILKLFDSEQFDLIGASVNNLDTWNGIVRAYDKANGFPRRSFGCFMACRTYTYIPEQLKVYSGDVFLFDQASKVGIIGSGFIYSPISATISQYSDIKKSAMNDAVAYRALKASPETGLHIVIRTSGRPNYFKNCVNSIRKFAHDAFLHITIDDEKDLAYVHTWCKGFNYNYYLINRSTVERSVSRFNFTRKPFIYNHYFNIVKPFLKGRVMFLDDDDMLVETPAENCTANGFNLYRVRVGERVIPDDAHWKTITLNHISGISVMAWSHQLPDWNPQRGGDYDLINYMAQHYTPRWIDRVISAAQTRGNNGKRNDL